MERACWWNGHVGGTGMLVERACWWNGHVGGMGMLVERASWWNGHLARYQYSQAGRMPTPLLFIPPLSNAKNPVYLIAIRNAISTSSSVANGQRLTADC
ncbi:hypothetical protein [Moorena sp. SIO1F2]|uniref:hypothetical protein n=1 Tax=Moorena sp. SIO1F2 TaxID=2607819 RepID=UPI0025D2FB53|nr:hypothetical protein [Moorena sp. SIO1F2]